MLGRKISNALENDRFSFFYEIKDDYIIMSKSKEGIKLQES